MPSFAKLFIGCPTYGKADMAFAFDSVGDLVWTIARKHPEIEQMWMQRDVRTYRQEARQGIVTEAKKVGATHLLMLDDDHVFNGEVFSKIWSSMQEKPEERQVISALYFTRGLPCAPCIFKRTGQGTVPIYYYPKDELMQVDVVGFGFILFDMRVFERINPPWFNLSMGFGEDAAFCERLTLAGMQPWVHTGAQVGHILEQPYVLTEGDFFRYRQQQEALSGQEQVGEMGAYQLSFAGFDPHYRKHAGDGEVHQGEASRPWWRSIASRRGFLWGGRKLQSVNGGSEILSSPSEPTGTKPGFVHIHEQSEEG